jgi:hypothetical protein
MQGSASKQAQRRRHHIKIRSPIAANQTAISISQEKGFIARVPPAAPIFLEIGPQTVSSIPSPDAPSYFLQLNIL